MNILSSWEYDIYVHRTDTYQFSDDIDDVGATYDTTIPGGGPRFWALHWAAVDMVKYLVHVYGAKEWKIEIGYNGRKWAELDVFLEPPDEKRPTLPSVAAGAVS